MTSALSGQQIIANAIDSTTRLKTFIDMTANWQQDMLDVYHRVVMLPLAGAKLGKLPRGEAFERLQTCARLLETELATVCRRQDVDVWLTYVRRLPALIPGWEGDWVSCATLAIMKYAEWSAPTTGGTVELPGVAVLSVPWSREVAEGVGRIALLSRQMAIITSDCRWIGKGATVEHLGGGHYKMEIPADVNEAVMSYERRRPKTPPWHEIGIVPVGPIRGGDEIVIDGLADFRRAVKVRGMGLSTPTAYFPSSRSAVEVADVLDPYRKAIEEQYNITLPAVMHTAMAMTKRIAQRFPPSVKGTTFEFDQNPDDTRFAGGLIVLLSVFQRGLMMMPEAKLRAELSAEVCPPWSSNPAESAAHVKAFFQAFALDPARRNKIDVVRRLPFYRFLFTSPGGTCYIDLLAMAEFYRELVLGAREWAGTLHGDHFSMDVRRLAKRIPGVTALPKIVGLKYESGQAGEIDVPLLIGKGLYVVECKAYGKGAELMAGDPAATNARTQEIKSWVEQAQRVTETLVSQRTIVTPAVPNEVEEIEWVVCTAGQEFMRPATKFGSVGSLPRVCTVVELLKHLQDSTGKGPG